jgi:hypothetical protein
MIARFWCSLRPTAIRIPRASTLAILIAVALTVISSRLQAGTPTPSKDLWQSYMEAALQADKAEDFKTEALILANAVSLAKSHDATEQRLLLSQIPLMLAYVELGREDLWRPILKDISGKHLGDPDETMRSYISIFREYGWSYYDRWKQHQDDTSEDSFKQQGRLYGAEIAMRAEVTLRQTLLSDDEAGLGEAEASLGLVLTKKSDSSGSEEAYNQALQHLRGSGMKRATMQTLSDLLSIGDPKLADSERSVEQTQIDVLFLTVRNLVESAQSSLKDKQEDQFASQVGRASALLEEVSATTADIRKRWPRHPFFGILEAQIAWLHQTEFAMTKMHADQYPDAFAKAKDAFERSIAIIEYSKGPKSQELRTVATSYLELLIAAGQTDQANRLAQRYGVRPDN